MPAILRTILQSVLLTLAMMPAWAEAPAVRVLAADPPGSATLHPGEPVYLRLQYSSATSLRLRVRGYLHGTEQVAGARSNTMPPYPRGQGEALVWIDYARPQRVDELRVELADQDWHPLGMTLVHPVDLAWIDGRRTRPLARSAWIDDLAREQQAMTTAALAQQPIGEQASDVLTILAAWAVPGYLVLQFLLYRRWQGGWRRLALAPLWLTVPVLAYTLFALAMGSNLWPLVMLFTFPLAFAYLLALTLVRGLVSVLGR